MPIESLPRCCPVCQHDSIIGHGTRRKQSHDERRDWIRIRRGLCQRCRKTFTILPLWSLPYAPYSLTCRQQAFAEYESCGSIEQAAPHLKDTERTPDASTIRRWLRRRFGSWLASLRFELLSKFRLPTIFAWDWPAAAVNLRMEAISP